MFEKSKQLDIQHFSFFKHALKGDCVIFTINNLSVTMKRDLRTLLSGLDLSLAPGDRCAVIGEEGNGKSTLLKLIYDPSLIEDYAEYSGRITRDHLIMGYLSQELTETQLSMTAYEYCCGMPVFLERSMGELAAVSKMLGIQPEIFYSDQSLQSFSGGEKVKLRMALLLLSEPDLLLLDEPSGDLDIETLRWMEGFLQVCAAPVLYISHDETLLENTANMILHMEQLRRKTLPRHVVARCGYREYVDNRLSSFEHQTRVALKEKEEQQKQQERYSKLYQNVQQNLRNVSRQNPHGGKMLKRKMKAVKSMGRRYDREAEGMTELPDSEEAILIKFPSDTALPAGKTVLELSVDLLKAGDKILAESLHLLVKGGEHLCIIGPNGAGKTTFLKKIAQELLPRTDIRAGYMPQSYSDIMDPELSTVDFLTDGSRKKDEITRAKTYLGSMKYTAEETGHPLSELSGGQKAKLFLLKMILSRCNVLILDEPTRNFSPLSGPVIRSILREFPGTIISVSHDRKFIDEVCERQFFI